MAGFEGITRFFSGAGSAKDVYGERPIVPEFPSLVEMMKQITKGNIAALPSLKTLGTGATDLLGDLMEVATPGVTELKNLGTKALRSMILGELPKEVMDTRIREAAEYGVGSGTGGTSQFTGARKLRDLGIEQLKYIQGGIDSATRWINQAQSQTFDFSKMFLGIPEAKWQAEGQFSRDWLTNQVAAAPDPTARGKFDAEMSWIGMILSAYGGGAGYTQQYRPNYGTSQGGYGGGTGGGYSYFGGPSGYGTTYQGEGGNMYRSAPNEFEGGGMSVPY